MVKCVTLAMFSKNILHIWRLPACVCWCRGWDMKGAGRQDWMGVPCLGYAFLQRMSTCYIDRDRWESLYYTELLVLTQYQQWALESVYKVFVFISGWHLLWGW